MSELEQKHPNRKKGAKSVTKEKIAEAKRRSLQVVESLLEPSVSEHLLISLCDSISQDDYLNVIEERNIILLCGYPLCPKELKPVRQKYHISVKTHKVYDLTERKCFCSGTCYKASNFLKAQLCDSPIWLKEKDAGDKPISLLCPTKNSGSEGAEVDLGALGIVTDDIEWDPDKNEGFPDSSHLSHLLDDFEICASESDKLKITEKHHHSVNTDSMESSSMVSEKTTQYDEVDVDLNANCDRETVGLMTEQYEKKVNTPEESILHPYLDSDDDDDDDTDNTKLLEDHNKYDSLASCNKYMPVIPKAKIRSTLLIDPLGNPDKVPVVSAAAEKNGISRDLVQNVLKTWFSIETFHIILGESNFELLKNKIIEEVKATPVTELQNNNIDKLKKMKEEYAQICLKLEKEEAIELKVDSLENAEKIGHSEVIAPPPPPANKKKVKKPKPTQRKIKGRNGANMIPVKMKEMEPAVASSSREFSVLPAVESLSQNTIRRQIVVNHLKFVYANMLPLVGLHYGDIHGDIQSLVSTFSLSSTNITFKPPEWRMIAVILFRMIEKKLTTEKIWAQETCWQLLKEQLLLFDISLNQIDAIIASVTDHTNLKKVLGF